MTFSSRLLATAMGAIALTAQNPLAVPSDPFSGTFQNERMKLDLAVNGAGYSGVILLGGKSLPVKAKAEGGKLTGTFYSQGQTYAFQATRGGSQLSLITDGVTHVLETAAAAANVAAPSFVGDWQSQGGVIRISADGSATIGDKSHRWTMDGNVITLTGNGESIKVPFEMAGNTWTWKFPDGQLVLTRIAASNTVAANKGIVGSWQGPNGNVQINLDGTATVAGVIYRYTQTSNQLTLTGADGTFVAAVQQSGDTMNWVVNGKTLTFQRAATTWAVGGANTEGGILPELVGKWCQSTGSGTCFTLLADGSYFYIGDFGADATASDSRDAGKWTATASSITATSKSAGARTLRLEKRNHPKTGDPMLVLDGAEYTTAYRKTPWR
ncbi:MAG: hypothetical protein ACKV2U_27325 [Bryobacteraceae bacterium]